MEFHREKSRVRAFHAALDARDWPAAVRHVAPGCQWRGYHPFNELVGPEAPIERFWQPLHGSLSHLQRREDVFFAGLNEIDGFTSTWVVSMGHFVGLFDAPFLGIPPTGKSISINVIDIIRIAEGQFVEHWGVMDQMAMMQQLGAMPEPGQS